MTDQEARKTTKAVFLEEAVEIRQRADKSRRKAERALQQTLKGRRRLYTPKDEENY